MTYTKTPITKSTTQLVYSYTARSLLAPYSAGAGATLLFVLIWFYALVDNGVSHSSSFSGILCTTRNPELDIIAKGQNLGILPLKGDVAAQRVQFGLSRPDIAEDIGHAPFGSQTQFIL
jgi:hypothetical protein